MAKISGRILKMKTTLTADNQAHYKLGLINSGNNEVDMNELVGRDISLDFSGDIFSIYSGEKITKSFAQGHSYKEFMSLASCDTCIMKPELCHFHNGTCRQPEWGEENCNIDHYVYLSETSDVKVGITRHSQLPTRWIDQGALSAIKVVKTKNRHIAGIIENEMRQFVSDKTHWKKMLEAKDRNIDLVAVKEDLVGKCKFIINALKAEICDDDITSINFPIKSLPEKVKSISPDKESHIAGKLIGIKGQYLIFDAYVINLRRYQGYQVELNF
jgi:hypothetical protein